MPIFLRLVANTSKTGLFGGILAEIDINININIDIDIDIDNKIAALISKSH